MGVFNEVIVNCPQCGEQTGLQSKASFYECSTFYPGEEIPEEIIQDLESSGQSCYHCDYYITVKVEYVKTLKVR